MIANIQYIQFHLISASDLSSNVTISVQTFHFGSALNINLLRDNLKLHPNNITMPDNIIASTFNNIPLHIRSSMNVKLFKTHS